MEGLFISKMSPIVALVPLTLTFTNKFVDRSQSLDWVWDK